MKQVAPEIVSLLYRLEKRSMSLRQLVQETTVGSNFPIQAIVQTFAHYGYVYLVYDSSDVSVRMTQKGRQLLRKAL
ncbi:hypothetical protein [Listeria riparia]|uniref:Uncharacterized protein n=1 Tax=Listeria riparia FSL S10-1204 TaxID=1265816 RepID=W7D064_9LIST|nr:hypothetical protein [Listeria riparia]EUJ42410.1 hypothetical protein PRIP_16322 [Listeria riparia FSL S10-1204]